MRKATPARTLGQERTVADAIPFGYQNPCMPDTLDWEFANAVPRPRICPALRR